MNDWRNDYFSMLFFLVGFIMTMVFLETWAVFRLLFWPLCILSVLITNWSFLAFITFA